jgi:syntaxin-binding protein 1
LIGVQEFPLVRYRAARSAAANATTTTTARDLVPTKIAAGLWERLMKYKSSLQNFPQTETCELIIVDRSVDPVLYILTYLSTHCILSFIY